MRFVLQLAAKIFSYYKATLQPTERNSRMWFLFEEELLYDKISKKDVYVDYGATADISQDADKQYGNLTALKQVKQIILILM